MKGKQNKATASNSLNVVLQSDFSELVFFKLMLNDLRLRGRSQELEKITVIILIVSQRSRSFRMKSDFFEHVCLMIINIIVFA